MLEYSMLYPETTVSRRVVSMDGMWKFCLDGKAEGEALGWTKGVPGDEVIPVPASFQDFYTDKDTREYAGDMWYEKDVFVPGEWEGKNIFVRFRHGRFTIIAKQRINSLYKAEKEDA